MTCHAPRSRPAARTRTSTCSSPMSGICTSLRRRTSGGPYRSRTIAFIVLRGFGSGAALARISGVGLSINSLATQRGSLVVQRVEDVQPRGAAGWHDRRREAGEDGDDREGGELGDRDRERDVVLRQRLGDQPGEEDAEWEAEGGADQRGDDALVADHAARLAPGQADLPQHPELARALDHAEQGVFDHPNRLTTTE